jgi:hypothetical protein
MSEECKHGLRTGCAYCHARTPADPAPRTPGQRRRARSTPMSEKMNDRMTALQRRLKQIRGQT